jgi:malate dehydrogenase (oxaloacetate-decarboxylating)(NADP+)
VGEPTNSRPSAFQLLFDARLNKAGAFTAEERTEFGLDGLLPDAVETHHLQLQRARVQFDAQPTDLGRYQFMSALHDRQERLFFALIRSDFQRFMPIVYTPTVGEACQRFGHIMRRPKGMYISIRHRGRIAQVLRNWPVRDVRFIVVTDGERILGLGDLGVCGMPIPIGKLALYTACAGVPPQVTLPVVLDMGTNNKSFLEDPLYPGLRQQRAAAEEARSFVDEFVEAAQEVFPTCCIQFEDFTNRNAIPMLERYRNRVCMFNDDIQGTAAVGIAGLFGACRMARSSMRDQRLLFFGAGNAAVGIADLFVRHLETIGVCQSDAVGRCHFMNSRGLVHAGMGGLPEYLRRYAHPITLPVAAMNRGNEHSPIVRLLDALEHIRPTGLIGVSAVPNTFDEAVIRSMARINSRPIIFPLSNPTSKSECTAEQAIRWSDGRAIVATGSPFPPMHFQGKLFVPGQGNNVYIYPAIGMAVYATQARRVTDEMFLRAAESLAAQTTDQDLSVGLIFPPIASILDTSIRIAVDVASLVFDAGLARIDRPEDIDSFVRQQVYDPDF